MCVLHFFPFLFCATCAVVTVIAFCVTRQLISSLRVWLVMTSAQSPTRSLSLSLSSCPIMWHVCCTFDCNVLLPTHSKSDATRRDASQPPNEPPWRKLHIRAKPQAQPRSDPKCRLISSAMIHRIHRRSEIATVMLSHSHSPSHPAQSSLLIGAIQASSDRRGSV